MKCVRSGNSCGLSGVFSVPIPSLTPLPLECGWGGFDTGSMRHPAPTHTLPPPTPHYRRSGFTLVEIMTVVVILGILAAIVIPLFARIDDDTRIGVAYTNLSKMGEAFEKYRAFNAGRLPDDVSPGQVPTGMERYLRPTDFTNVPQLGDAWDWNGGPSWAPGRNISIWTNQSPNPYKPMWDALDAKYDDGNPNTGKIREITTGGNHLALMLE
jgi:prepilin-type N-terminal cleavage/methylation domain-containing protein